MRNVIMYVAFAYSPRFDSRTVCTLLDDFLDPCARIMLNDATVTRAGTSQQ